MYYAVLPRPRAGDAFSGRRFHDCRVLHDPGEIPVFDEMSIVGIWSQDPAERFALPEVLVTSDGAERDWLAWLVNFVSIRPITAFCRILGISAFGRQYAALHAPDLGGLQNACVGMVLGEVLSSVPNMVQVREGLTVAACQSALSFALMRSLAIGSPAPLEQGSILDRWLQTRKLTRQRERELSVGSIVRVAEVLQGVLTGSVTNRSDPIKDAVDNLLNTGNLGRVRCEFGAAFELAASEILNGTREERVATFSKAISDITVGDRDALGFAFGYLASCINPGTLSHAQLLQAVCQRAPTAILWYAVCAGLVGRTVIMSELGGIGRRILRDLEAPDDLVSRPRCDVSVGELEILLSQGKTDEFPVTSGSQLTVELNPGVWTVANWTSRARERRGTGALVTRSDDREWIAEELGAGLARLVELYQRIREPDSTEGSGQQTLFNASPGRRKKR